MKIRTSLVMGLALVLGVVLFAFGTMAAIFGNSAGGLNALDNEASSDCTTDQVTLPPADSGAGGIQTAARAALRAGWTGQDAVVAVAVAGAESEYNPRAANPSSTARGMWQVMLSYHQPKFAGADWRDPYANARVAHRIWADAHGWRPWTTYTGGSYRAYMGKAAAAISQVGTQDIDTKVTTVVPAGVKIPGLQPVAQKAYDAVRDQFAFKGTIGGFSERNIAGTGVRSKHSEGLAIDVMTADTKVGNPIADYFAGPGYKAYGVDNVIWRGRIYNAARGWHTYRNATGRPNKTLDHYDHVHVDFTAGGGSGAVPAVFTGTQQCVQAASAPGTVTWPVANHASDRHNFGGSGAHWARTHTGTDFSVPCGTPVLAATAGTIQIDHSQSWAGPNLVKVSTGATTLSTWYAHMEAVTVKVGQQVQPGQQIGRVGQMGNATGCHLHFEVHPKNGSIYADDTNPSTWLAQNVGKDLGSPSTIRTVSSSVSGQANIVTANMLFTTSQSAMQAHLASVLGSGADIVILEEVAERKIPAMAAKAGGGWGVWQPAGPHGKRANVILWRLAKFKAIGQGVLPGFNTPHYSRWFPWVALEDGSGSRVGVIGLHMPVGAPHSAARLAAYRLAMSRYQALARELSAKVPTIAGGDWNSSLQKSTPSWGPVVQNRRIGFTTNWQGGSPCSGGSLKSGGRIDGFAYSPSQVQKTAQGCLSRGPSDHRPVWMTARY